MFEIDGGMDSSGGNDSLPSKSLVMSKEAVSLYEITVLDINMDILGGKD
jgi:hypothetical protein